MRRSSKRWFKLDGSHLSKLSVEISKNYLTRTNWTSTSAPRRRLFSRSSTSNVSKWKRPSLKDRRAILEPALAAFKRGDPVSCLKILLTEMEGVIQDAHIADLGAGAKVKELLKYAAQRGLKKTGDESSLLFPNQFLQYLSDYTYADFDPKDGQADTLSRHSVGHGSARASAYTMTRALQAILALDQLSFYL
jgi:hypothetical protein